MADTPISGLTAIQTVEQDDLLVIVDVHDTTMASTGTDKQMTIAQLLEAITGDVSFSSLASTVDSVGGISVSLAGAFSTSGALHAYAHHDG